MKTMCSEGSSRGEIGKDVTNEAEGLRTRETGLLVMFDGLLNKKTLMVNIMSVFTNQGFRVNFTNIL